MKIRMTQAELISLANFLNQEYERRREAAWADKRKYSMSQFAKDVGINQSTMSRYMRLGPEKNIVEAMDTPLLLAFYDAFGDAFVQSLRGDSVVVVKKRARKNAKPS